MRVRFWGVRGSLPVPGRKTERYGGNTSCVEVLSDEGTRIVVDAGTGLRRLGKELVRAAEATTSGRPPSPVHVLISHTHWDHIQGLPFFAPLYENGRKINVYARKRDDIRLRSVLASQAEAPYFTIPLDEACAEVGFQELPDEAQFGIADVHVACARLNHPYIATAYALSANGRKVAYVSDTAPFDAILFGEEFVPGPPPPGSVLSPSDRAALLALRSGVVRLCEGADLVIYDTMFTPEDYRATPHFGHSRPSDAIAICQEAGAKRLALYHHAPERSDAEVDAMLAEARSQAARIAPGLDVVAAFEGMDFDVGDDPTPAQGGR